MGRPSTGTLSDRLERFSNARFELSLICFDRGHSADVTPGQLGTAAEFQTGLCSNKRQAQLRHRQSGPLRESELEGNEANYASEYVE